MTSRLPIYSFYVWIKKIVEGRVKHVVVSLGAGGAYLINGSGTIKYDSPVVPVDSMIAGISLSLAQGKSIEESVRLGVGDQPPLIVNKNQV